MFSAGRNLYLYRLDPLKGKLIEIANITLPFDISSIRGDENRICVTSRTNSMSFYKLNTEFDTIEFLKWYAINKTYRNLTKFVYSDAIPRSLHQSLMVNSRFGVGVGPLGSVVGLLDDIEDEKNQLKTMFAFHYSDMITKPNLALLRSLHGVSDVLLSSHILPWDSDTITSHSTPEKPIVGCTVSGGIVHIHRIDRPLYNVLIVLQDILLDYEPTKPLLGSPSNFRSWYRMISGKEKSTIHGDVVESFLRLSLEEQKEAIQDNEGNIKLELKEAMNTWLQIHDLDQTVATLSHLLSSFERYR